MKHIVKSIRLAAVLLCASATVFACRQESGPQKETVVPDPVYLICGQDAEDVINISVDSTMTFVAEISNTEDFSCAWYVEDEKMANTASFIYTFSDPGSFSVRFEASNQAGTAVRTFTVNVAGVPLEASWSVEDETISAKIGEEVQIEVTILSGDKDTRHSWKLDGEEVSVEKTFSRTFSEPGQHALTYLGTNRDNETASRSWTLSISDLDLAATYTPLETQLETTEGAELKFSANVTSGVFGLVHSWKVNGETAGDRATFSYEFAAAGDYVVEHTASNAAGASLTHVWNVTVEKAADPGPSEPEEGVFVYDTFENSAIGVSSYYIGNKVSNVNVMEVVDNPFRTSANSSAKVLLDHGSLMTWNSSGYFKFKINTLPDGTSIGVDERAKYTKLRVKIYLGDSGFTPLLQEDAKSTKSTPCMINGVAFDTSNPTMDEWNAAVKTNDWNVFVYDLTGPKYSSDVNSLAQTEQLQFRVFVDFNNNGKAGRDIYFDDIEFLE